MLFRWAITFFIIAIIAAIFGFGGVAGTAAEAAKILFYVGIILFLGTLVYGLVTGGKGNPPLP